jgi:hypothetical protein
VAAVAASTRRREPVPLARRVQRASAEAAMFAADRVAHWTIVENHWPASATGERLRFWIEEMDRLDDQASLLFVMLEKGWL